LNPVDREIPTAPVSRLHSLRTRLTILVSSLVILITGALAVVSYSQVRSLAVASARARLQSLTRQLASSSGESARQRLDAISTMAGSAAVVGFMRQSGAATRAAAARELETLLRDSTVIRVALLDAANNRVLGVGDSTALSDLQFTGDFPAGSLAVIGPPLLRGDSVVFVTSALIRDDGRALGRLNMWRRVALTAGTRQQYTELIGSRSEVYLGGGDPVIWMDLSGRVVRDFAASPAPGEVFERRRDGELHLAVVERIPGTPWQIAVDFPVDAILEQPRTFLGRLLGATAALLLVAVGLTWWMSGRVTMPLARLTEAAERVSAGDYAVFLDAGGTDEIGRLSRAFRIMILRVQDSLAQLQGELAERTDEMRATFQTLEKSLDDLAKKDREGGANSDR